MSDLVAFLRACLDDDERLAMAAGERDGYDWTHARRDDDDHFSGGVHAGRGEVVSNSETSPHQGEHIARWDPARVLAEVEAKRRILDLHGFTDDGWNEGDEQRCTECGWVRLEAGWGQRGSQRAWPCTTLRLLASPYADRDGYDESWRP